MKILVNCTGFIGDILFSTSVAEKLKLEGKADIVDYLIHLYQPYELLTNNPHIDDVFLFQTDFQKYDRVIKLHEIDFTIPPPQYYQMVAGVENTSPQFHVYTNPAFDFVVSKSLKPYKDAGKVIVAYMSSWEERTFLFTEEEYARGVDVPNLGYGGKHRNTDEIVSELAKDERLLLIPVGMPPGFNVREANFSNTAEYSMQASFLKQCDYFIGAEGGLCNLAAGVGTRTIITGDFIHQLYGWNGVLKQIKEPKLGPKYYFGNRHITLDPYLTDVEVLNQIKSNIQ